MEIEVNAEAGSVSLDNISGTYTAKELRELIQALCQAQAQIASDPSEPTGQQVLLFTSTHWFTSLFTQGGGQDTALTMLIPGLGWTGLVLPPKQRVQLTSLLATQQLISMSSGETPTTPAGEPAPGTSGGNVLH